MSSAVRRMASGLLARGLQQQHGCWVPASSTAGVGRYPAPLAPYFPSTWQRNLTNGVFLRHYALQDARGSRSARTGGQLMARSFSTDGSDALRCRPARALAVNFCASL